MPTATEAEAAEWVGSRTAATMLPFRCKTVEKDADALRIRVPSVPDIPMRRYHPGDVRAAAARLEVQAGAAVAPRHRTKGAAPATA